jgi:hypothetical protein
MFIKGRNTASDMNKRINPTNVGSTVMRVPLIKLNDKDQRIETNTK